MPRKSSPKGVEARLAARIKGYEQVITGRDKIASMARKPGSRNRRKS
jgi:hypothetical protein